ncbi:MAG: hydrogenase maturation nickel metallochaperone HypA [Gammaproteobacteria bacterium]|nr:hydrogenase maturation nickel metallochaperone HypA [Gammaproteobacteria bacterium]
MHELGYATEIVSTLEDYMVEQNLKKIHEITLTVGEATGVLPKYMYECWPAAIMDTKLSDCKLNINYIRVIARCLDCDELYEASLYHCHCPKCGSEEYTLTNGYEFEITEIKAE